MAIDRSLISGSTAMLLLKLLEKRDMYGYEMIEELARLSDNTFALKAGTLYPLLHTLEQKGHVSAYDKPEGGRARRFYHLTDSGQRELACRQEEWSQFSGAVEMVLNGGELCVCH